MTKRTAKAKGGSGLTAKETAELESLKASLRPPTEAEATAIRVATEAQKQRPARPTVKLVKQSDGVISISNPHEDHAGWQCHLAETVGTRSTDAANQALARIWGAVQSRTTPITQEQANAVLALMSAIGPRDELEAAIGEQIVAAHIASLEFLSRARLNAGEYVDTAASYAGMATKLSRTMATQIEALAKLRSGGKQQVIVKHVYVNGDAYVGDNGQAAFGGVRTQGGGGVRAKPGQTHEPIGEATGVDALGPTVWGEDPRRDALPSPRDEKAPPLQAPWGKGHGRANGEGEWALQNRPLDEGAAAGPRPGARRRSQRAA